MGESETAKQSGPTHEQSSAFQVNENPTEAYTKENSGSLSKSGATEECVICKSRHGLDECASFKKMTLEERTDLIKESRICWSCLKGGHRSRYCRNKKICSTCNGNHPTLMHKESQQSKV